MGSVPRMSMDWDKLRVFHAAAEAGSFTHAGEALHLSQSAVSRQISALEESLSCTLFHRHARGLLLTEQGQTLYATVHDVFAKLAKTQRAIADSQTRAEGRLRVTTTIALGTLWLAPRLHEFFDRHPKIQITLLTTDAELDLGMREADCAIRLSPPSQPDLVQRRLMVINTHPYAAISYVQTHGLPETPADLDRHRLIAFGSGVRARPPVPDINWLLEVGTDDKPRRAILEVNSAYGILRAVKSGIGVGVLPDYLAAEHRDLMPVLPDLGRHNFPAYFIYPEELRHSPRLAAFRDFVVEKVAETPF